MANSACHIRGGDTLLLPPVGGLGTFHHLPMTGGSKSTNIALGTCFPEPVSLKKVPKEESACPEDASEEMMPPGWIPCSRQYSSQQELPIWMPAWSMWIEILCIRMGEKRRS